MPAGYWVIRSYEAGPVGEKTKFWIPGERPLKSGRREKSELRKQEQNAYSAERKLARLINANCGTDWVLLGLDYSEAGMRKLEDWACAQGQDIDALDEGERADILYGAAEREMRLALRRVGRELARAGANLNYMASTSDMDGKTGEAVRVHHHLLVPADTCEIFKRKWAALGSVDWRRLDHQDDYTPIAHYIIEQVRHVPDAKKFTCSQNLTRPQPRDRVAVTDAELRIPRGAKLLHRSEYKPGAPQYIRFVLPEYRRMRE